MRSGISRFTEERRMSDDLKASLNLPFAETVQKVKEAFQAEGFGVITETDMQKTLKDKIGKEIEPYTILGVCNPNFAYRALQAEHEIGLMLPCTALVHECEGQTKVAVQDPAIMVQLLPSKEMEPIIEEVREKLARAIQHLKS